jgi:hypothetical protein
MTVIRKHLPRLLLFCSLIVLIANCTPSLTYSPSIHPPAEPLKQGQINLVGGMGKLVEARPYMVKKPTAEGREVLLRYGVSDKFALQFKYWKDYSSNLDKSRSGITYSNMILLNSRNAPVTLGLIPTGGFVFLEEDIEGGGAYFPLLLWYNRYRPVAFYLAGGLGVGIRNIADRSNQWGWGLLATLGISGRLEDRFDLTAELTRIKQVNEGMDRTDYIIAPSISIGLVFPR